MTDTPEMVERCIGAMTAATNDYQGLTLTEYAKVHTQKSHAERLVRAVIEAMREPTEAMDRAGNRATCSDIRCTCEETQIYRAYIDEALK